MKILGKNLRFDSVMRYILINRLGSFSKMECYKKSNIFCFFRIDQIQNNLLLNSLNPSLLCAQLIKSFRFNNLYLFV